MTCRQWVDKGHMACVDSSDIWSARCVSWRDDGYSKCDNWADEGSNECSQWKDEGYNQCDREEDRGYKNCCDWWPCSWACKAWTWISHIVCVAWHWIANVVCQAWYWVANWVCKAWYWVANIVCQAWVSIVTAVCLVWSWVAKLVCVAWDGVRCFFNGIFRSPRRNRSPVKHVFVLIMENRSFDHMLGHSSIRGREAGIGDGISDPGIERQVNGVFDDDGMSKGFSNDFEDGGSTTTIAFDHEAKFKLDEPPDYDPPHEFSNAILALFGTSYKRDSNGMSDLLPPTNSGFLTNYARGNDKGKPQNLEQAMRGYSEERTPVLHALAREFALLDRWHSSLPGPTWPNRFFAHAASSGGLDDSPSLGSELGNMAFDGYTFANGTIFDKLEDSCLEWRVFAGDHFPVTLALSGMTIADIQGRISDYDDFEEAIADEDYSPAYTFIEPDYGAIWSDFHCGNSQHPMDDVTRGEHLIKSVYETLRKSPHWKDSLLLVTYDEHGGFFDHAPPPEAPPPGDGIADEDNNHNDFAFDWLGVRVPAIAISPLIERNLLDGSIYEHSSIPRTVEDIFGLSNLTERDSWANGLTHLITRVTARDDAPERLPEPANSGYSCDLFWDGDQDFVSSKSNSEALTKGRDGRRIDLSAEPQSTTVGFLQIALLRALTTARGRDHARIRREYAMIRTEGGARHFMAKTVRMIIPQERINSGRSSLERFLFLPAKQRWIPTPLSQYRDAGIGPGPMPVRSKN